MLICNHNPSDPTLSISMQKRVVIVSFHTATIGPAAASNPDKTFGRQLGLA